MIRSVLRRANYANVVATLALLVALATGGAYAASKLTAKDIAKNAVRSKHIKRGQVKPVDLKPAERYRLVGRPGQPGFGSTADCLWRNAVVPPPNEDQWDPVGFYRDPYGVVHLTGVAEAKAVGGGDCDDVEDWIIYTLPPRYRPARTQLFSLIGASGPGAEVVVTSGGLVAYEDAMNDAAVTMGGVTFRGRGRKTGITPARAAGASASAGEALAIRPGQ